MIYFISDLHFGHKNCIAMCNRPFADVDEMDEALINAWNDRVKNDDTVYIVGDLLWEKCDIKDYLPRLNGKKILIAGNHDYKWLKRAGMAKRADDGHVEYCGYSEYFTNIAQFVEIRPEGIPITLCHYPMLEWKASRKLGSQKLGYLIYGHIHNSKDNKYAPLWVLPHALNASADVNGFTPVTFDELIRNNEAFKLSAFSDNVDKALFLARKYHLYQTDRSGKPYIEHPLFVAKKQRSRTAKCVALLHDILEDTDIDLSVLENNFSQEVVSAVKLLTRNDGEDYFDYINRLSVNKTARAVKLADLAHNSDLSRLKEVTDKDAERLEKYKRAKEILLTNSEFGMRN